VLNNKREALKKYLNDKGIATGVHYPRPLHEQPCIIDYMKDNYNEMIDGSLFPVTNQTVQEILSLPMYPSLSKKTVVKVVKAIKTFYKEEA
jgi:dTDP-4-amino-4,6-dideoxygalactose transaminase